MKKTGELSTYSCGEPFPDCNTAALGGKSQTRWAVLWLLDAIDTRMRCLYHRLARPKGACLLSMG